MFRAPLSKKSEDKCFNSMDKIFTFMKRDEPNAFSVFLISVAWFFVFFKYALRFDGPAYLSDEVGYLSKAAAISGYSVDHPSSWHAGYSFLIAPAFYFFDGYEAVWRGVQAINSLMFACSFWILYHALLKFYPGLSARTVLVAAVVSTFYPAWLVMSGYAFATPAIVLVYVLLFYFFTRIEEGGWFFLVLVAFLAGFSYWMHPTGIVVVFSSLMAVLFVCRRSNSWVRFVSFLSMVSALVVLYKLAVHPFLDGIMTHGGIEQLGHYPEATKVIDRLMSEEFWKIFPFLLISQFLASVISSFGFLAVGLLGALLIIFQSDSARYAKSSAAYAGAALLLSGTVFGVLMLGALLFSLDDFGERVDVWIYGRYVDPYIYPMIAIGFLAVKNRRAELVLGFLLMALVLFFYSFSGVDATGYNNLVNISSFWPYALFPGQALPYWLAIGVTGTFLFMTVGRWGTLVLATPLVVISIITATNWHALILSDYSKKDAVVDFIDENFSAESCTAYDVKGAEKGVPERRSLLVFYLYEQSFKRMSFEKWFSECDGPFLTQRKMIPLEGVRLVAYSSLSGLFVFVKDEVADRLSYSAFEESNYFFDPAGNWSCSRGSCLAFSASALEKFSQVGQLSLGYLETTGVAGYLFFGPYVVVDKGKYEVTVSVTGKYSGTALLDVVSDGGNTSHAIINITDEMFDFGVVSLKFELQETVNDLEVRLKVDENSSINVRSVRLVPKLEETARN